jgi:hypothetical protein
MSDDTDSSTDEPATETTQNAVTSTYKILGEFTATDGSAILGQNNAASGTPVGIEGAVPNADGYGLSTPDDAKVEGAISTTGGFSFDIENDSGTALSLGTRDTFTFNSTTFEGPGNVLAGQLSEVKSTDIVAATIAGGGLYDQTNGDYYRNRVTDHAGTVGGGYDNRAGDNNADLVQAVAATVSGGSGNTASASRAAIGGGRSNTASAAEATVAGGASNEASGEESTVSGGEINIASDEHSTIGGGLGNTASAPGSTVPGGESCTADGEASFAAGRQAKTGGYDGAFVWGGSDFSDVTATASGEVRFRAAGGFAIQDGDVAIEDGNLSIEGSNSIEDASGNTHLTVNDGGSLDVQRTLNLNDQQLDRVSKITGNVGAGGDLRLSARNQILLEMDSNGDSSGGFILENAFDDTILSADTSGSVFAGNLATGSGTALEINGGEIVEATSSARYKTDIGPAKTDTAAALDLELKSFEYEETGEEDVGLIAEEVEAILPELVNYDEEGRPESISYDRIGAFLAPEVRENRDRLEREDERIDELESDLEQKADRIDKLEAENDELHAELDRKDERIEALETRLAAIEDRLDAPAPPADD